MRPMIQNVSNQLITALILKPRQVLLEFSTPPQLNAKDARGRTALHLAVSAEVAL